METTNPFEAQQQAWKDAAKLYFEAKGYDEASIDVGMAWGLSWLNYTQLEALRFQESQATLSPEELGRIMDESWKKSYAEHEPQMRDRGLMFPNGMPWLTLYGVANETFTRAHGPDAERAEELIALMRAHQTDKSRLPSAL